MAVTIEIITSEDIALLTGERETLDLGCFQIHKVCQDGKVRILIENPMNDEGSVQIDLAS